MPGTIAENGDPLDILCLSSQAIFPGCWIEVRLVGLFDMLDAGQVDQKILAVPSIDPRFSGIFQLNDVFSHVRWEVEDFFTIHEGLESAAMSTEGGREVEKHTSIAALPRRELFRLGA